MNLANLGVQNGPEVAEHARIQFQVLDKDTFSSDDLVGKVASSFSLNISSLSGKHQTVDDQGQDGGANQAGAGEPKRQRDSFE